MQPDDLKSTAATRPKWRRLGVAFLGLFLLLCVVSAIAGWNMVQMPGKSFQGELPAADDSLRNLEAELRRYVGHLATKIGQRDLATHPQQLARAADWIEQTLEGVGCSVKRQQYEVSGVGCDNLEVEIRGVSTPDEIVVVGTHYDAAAGTPGANDNGSGVAAVLALAGHYAHRPGIRTLRFIAFANEEPPHFQTEKMGSLVYARRCGQRNEKIVAMLSLETIGYYSDKPESQHYPPPLNLLYPSTGNFIAFVGNLGSAGLVRRVVGLFREHEPFPSEGGAPPDVIPGVGFSDHWSFWQVGYPALMVTDTAMYRYPYYHEAEDMPEKIDFSRTARVVRGLEKVIAGLVGGT